MNVRMFGELFGSVERFKALQCIFSQPGADFGARDLALQAGIGTRSASRWLGGWAAVGLLEKRTILNRTRYLASTDPSLAHLRALLTQDCDLVRWLQERIAPFGEDIVAAAIFGSVARGEDHSHSDVDMLLLTDRSTIQLHAAFAPVGRRVGRQINVTVYPPAVWRRDLRERGGLAFEIVQGALIPLKGKVLRASIGKNG